MTRTRQQQQAARAAARQWRRAELRRLLDAWQRVLRYPQTQYETSDELEHRIYARFQLLTTATTNAAGNARATSRTLSDVALAMQQLKRSFLFVSSYNQTHCNRSSSSSSSSSPRARADPDASEPPSSSATTDGCSWFDLPPHVRSAALLGAQRGRRITPYVDLDRAMHSAMRKIMAHTVAQLELRRRSHTPNDSDDAQLTNDNNDNASAEAPADSDVPELLLHTPATAPWRALEVRRLLHAWHETVADPHCARVHSDAYLTALYERFVDSCDGSTLRCSAAVRTKKTALMRFGALVRNLSARSSPRVDYVALTPTQRTQLLSELGFVCEKADVLDSALFVLLQHILTLEDDAYAAATRANADRVDTTSAADPPLEPKTSPHPPRSRSKRLRVDTDLFVVLDILEREATRLREMLHDATHARASDQNEHARLQQALEREKDAHTRAASAWQVERAALQDELVQLRARERRRAASNHRPNDQ